jgi:tRNA1(Val) A37 N6-methylase TrmN6
LDNLIIEDKIWDKINELGRYDFKSDLNINILGHIFEQSISDIERVKKELKGEVLEKSKSKQKKDGIYYTPTFITEYITNTCLDEYVNNGGVLENVKILDPACGSGAFLNQAYDSLFKRLNLLQNSDFMLETKIKDLASSILNNNLYGVDLQAESVEIAKLSLWLKTARSDRKLQNLDQNIKQGDSLLEFNWDQEFSSIKSDGGFDIIIGNPPYVRQELLNSELKNSLKNKFKEVGNSSADLYVYFIQQAIELLKDGGILGFIIPNKWLEREYAFELRQYLRQYEILKIINLSKIKVFENVIADPMMIIIKKQLSNSDIDYMIVNNTSEIINKELIILKSSKAELTNNLWRFNKKFILPIHVKTISLKEYTNNNLKYGIKTSANAIFIINNETKFKLVAEDPNSNELIKPLLESNDFEKWNKTNPDKFIINTGFDINIPDQYPAIYNYLKQFKSELIARIDQGKNYYNLRSCDYYDQFETPKIIYTHTTTKPKFYFDTEGYFISANSYMIPNSDRYLQAILNSNVFNEYSKEGFAHFGDVENSRGVRLDANKMQEFPIPIVDVKTKKGIELQAEELYKLSTTKRVEINKFIKYIVQSYGIVITNKNFILNFEKFEWSKILKTLKATNKDLNTKIQKEIFELHEELLTKIEKINFIINKTEAELNNKIDILYK